MKIVSTLLLTTVLSLACLGLPGLASTFDSSAPTLLWPYGTGGAILDVKSIPDVNGDGKPDVVAGSTDNNVYVLDGTDGSKIWNKLTGGDVPSVDYIEDVTDEGSPEIVCGSLDGKVYLLNGTDGKEIWIKQIDKGVPVHRVRRIQDVTGDGVHDVIAAGRSNSYDVMQCFDGTTGTSHWLQNPYSYGSTPHYNDFAILSDATGDGKNDVVWTYFFYAQYMQLINGATGAVEKSRTDLPRAEDYWVKLASLPDVSGDGFEDIVDVRVDMGSSSGSRALVLSGPTLEEIWRFEKSAVATDERTWDANYISDITFDGRPEIVIGWKDKVFVKNGVNGVEIWNITVTNGNSQYARSHRITEGRDISGDGIDDIVVGVQNGKVYFLSGKDGASILDPYQISGSVNSVAYLNDVTGDTVSEILVGGGDHFIYCLTALVRKPTSITVQLSSYSVKAGESVTVFGKLSDTTSGMGIPSAPVKIYVNGSLKATLTTNSTGWYKAAGPASTPGTCIIKAEYPGSSIYLACSATAPPLKVLPPLYTTYMFFNFTPNPTSPGQTITLRGILIYVDTANNIHPIGGATLNLAYSLDYGQTWKSAGAITTEPNGMFQKTFTAPALGVYFLKLSYAGSPSYAPVSSSTFLIVR